LKSVHLGAWPKVWRSGLVSALIALTAARVFDAGSSDFCLDDAYIHLSYALSLRLGDGFSYNPGDGELGATSPLWALLLAPLSGAADPVRATKWLGALLHALTAALTAGCAAALVARTHGRLALASGVLAGLLCALHPLLLQGATSGMEVPLASALCAGLVLALAHGRRTLSAALAALAVWARPEALAFAGLLGVGLAYPRPRMSALAPLAGAGAAMAAWSALCLAQVGHPLPNTFYVKRGHPVLSQSLAYLAERVASEEAWLLGVGGAVLAGGALLAAARSRDGLVLGLALAWLGTLLATALGRELHPAVTFYMQRYFAPFAFVPPLLVALGVARAGLRSLTLLVPCAVVLALRVPAAAERTRAQERSITRLHTEVAGWTRRELPHDARILVEGAGAMRFTLPREAHVIDLLGLNFSAVAHAPSPDIRDCLLAAAHPAYLALPSELMRPLAEVFEGEVLLTRRDPAYAHVEPAHPRSVYVVRVTGVTPRLTRVCRALSRSAAQ
jgi:hypothetical protein